MTIAGGMLAARLVRASVVEGPWTALAAPVRSELAVVAPWRAGAMPAAMRVKASRIPIRCVGPPGDSGCSTRPGIGPLVPDPAGAGQAIVAIRATGLFASSAT